MRRPLLLTAAMAASIVFAATPAAGITSYNSSPAPERTEVGALVAVWDSDGDPATLEEVGWWCSGTMIDADTFLTAAHCFNGTPAGTKFYVSLDQDVQGGLSAATGTAEQVAEAVGVRGTPHVDPRYRPSAPASDLHDLAVVEVPADAMTARWSFTPATLPTEDLLGDLGPQRLDDTAFTVVGYGYHEAQRGPGGFTYPGGGVRLKAPVSFNALNPTVLQIGTTRPQGNGGGCFGDSGGPNYAVIDGERILAGTTTQGDPGCYAAQLVYRLDTPAARGFLAPFVNLP